MDGGVEKVRDPEVLAQLGRQVRAIRYKAVFLALVATGFVLAIPA